MAIISKEVEEELFCVNNLSSLTGPDFCEEMARPVFERGTRLEKDRGNQN